MDDWSISFKEQVFHTTSTCCCQEKYRREFFCSHPAGPLVARFTADQPGGYSGAIEVRDSHGGPTTAGINRLSAAGRLSNGLNYEWQVLAEHEGGTLQTDGALLPFSNWCRVAPGLPGAGRGKRASCTTAPDVVIMSLSETWESALKTNSPACGFHGNIGTNYG
jgi:Glycosyl hydrolase family 65, N-terminal domain